MGLLLNLLRIIVKFLIQPSNKMAQYVDIISFKCWIKPFPTFLNIYLSMTQCGMFIIFWCEHISLCNCWLSEVHKQFVEYWLQLSVRKMHHHNFLEICFRSCIIDLFCSWLKFWASILVFNVWYGLEIRLWVRNVLTANN